jgi:aryl-alcohol dehydrogenase-like predicted oxidoreductase
VVSRVALGTVALGLDYGIPTQGAKLRPEAADAAQLLNCALDMGIKLIDTARSYGESEEIIGAAIGHRRQEYVLATKVTPTPCEPHRVHESVHASLRALRTDVIDLVQIHCGATDREPDACTTDALLELKRSGAIRHLGASVYSEESGEAAMASGHFDCLQVAYSALDRRIETTLLPAAVEESMGILARSVLLKGALTDRVESLPDELAPLKKAARELARLAASEVECLPELAYRYALSNPAIDSVLAGVTSIRELEQALLWAARGELSPTLLDVIRATPMLAEKLLTPAFWPSLLCH